MSKILTFFKRHATPHGHYNKKLNDEISENLIIDAGRVKSLLEKGASPNAYVGFQTALQRASLRATPALEVINLLLEAGGNPFEPVVWAGRTWQLSDVVKNSEVRAQLKQAEENYERIHGAHTRWRGCRLPSTLRHKWYGR